MKYTIRQFRADFPDEDTCLEYVFKKRFPEAEQYYRVKGRKCWANPAGEQIHPLAGTIFAKSSTPLTLWFYAIYMFAQSKNGVAAKELERQLGVTYKCAWRMARQIRKLMSDDGEPLTGEVEVDETYIGGKALNNMRKKNITIKDKEVLFGMVERGGRVKAKHLISNGSRLIIPQIKKNIEPKSTIYSDSYRAYDTLTRRGYSHSSVNHQEHFVVELTHTNTIEGFWSQLKRSINGTYHHVSAKHLQLYADEFAFRYSWRKSSPAMFDLLLARV
ncbi:MAG: IS1595 family transposase [Patescibacteria group bacterium]